MEQFEVVVDNGSLVYSLEKNKWTVKGKVKPTLLAIAQQITRDYEYTPSDGYPGGILTYRVAKAVDGKPIVEHPPVPKDVMC